MRRSFAAATRSSALLRASALLPRAPALAASPAASPIIAPALGATRGLAQRGLTPLEKRKLKQRKHPVFPVGAPATQRPESAEVAGEYTVGRSGRMTPPVGRTLIGNKNPLTESGGGVTHSPHLPLGWKRLDYPQLEVWDTAELVELQAQLVEERARLQAVHAAAKEEKRKVIWKNAELDLIKLIKLEGWIETVKKDDRRTW